MSKGKRRWKQRSRERWRTTRPGQVTRALKCGCEKALPQPSSQVTNKQRGKKGQVSVHYCIMAVKQQPVSLRMIFDLSHLSALWNGPGEGKCTDRIGS